MGAPTRASRCASRPIRPTDLSSFLPANSRSLAFAWRTYSEVLPPPSPPQARASLNARSSHGERANSERSSRRLHAADSSPFANFGRFGVDGGLSGEADAASTRNRRGAKGAFAAASSSEHDKDTAPHLLSRDRNADRGDRLRSRTGLDDTPRRNAGGGAEMTESGRRRGLDAGGSSWDAPESQSKRDARRGLGPADEGGWRNVGMTREGESSPPGSHTPSSLTTSSPRDAEREKRLARNHNSSVTDSPASRRDGGAFGARTGRPAWMDDESSERRESGGGGGGSPAWMDAPSTGKMSFDADGKARASPEDTSREKRNAGSKATRQRELETYTPTGGAAAGGGMDGMQMFKAQMKEREKRERERDMRAKGLPIESDEPSPSSRAEEPSSAAPQSKSIFEDLGIARAPPGLGSPSPAAREPVEGIDQGRGGGGRSPVSPNFLDGKPAPAPAEAPTNSTGPASIFESLMGGGGNGSNGPAAANYGQANAPSKEDADSMARLLGMLQVSGKRGASPGVPTKGFEASAAAMAPLPPGLSKEPTNSHADVPSPAPLPAQAASRGEEEAGRTKSRFKFSNPPPASSSQGPQGQQPAHASLQSPFVAAAHPPPGLASPARSRAPTTEGTTLSSNGAPPQSPRSARAPETILSPAPPPGGPLGNSFSPPPPGGLAHPQQPFFGHGGPPPPPSSQPPFSPPPNGPDGRFLAHQGPGLGPLPGSNQPPRPNMAPPPPFGFGPDGRPIPPPPHLGFLPSFGAVNMPPQSMPPGGALSPALASPPVVHTPGGGLRGPPSQFPFPGHGQMPPPPPPHLMFPPPHFNPGHMPLPPPPPGGPNQPSPLMNLGGNAGADLMALLNSGAGGQRIGANGPPNGVQVRQG